MLDLALQSDPTVLFFANHLKPNIEHTYISFVASGMTSAVNIHRVLEMCQGMAHLI